MAIDGFDMAGSINMETLAQALESSASGSQLDNSFIR